MTLTDPQILSMVRELVEDSLPTPDQRARGAQALLDAALRSTGTLDAAADLKGQEPWTGHTLSGRPIFPESDSSRQQDHLREQSTDDEPDDPFSLYKRK